MHTEDSSPLKGILFKLISVAIFLVMQTCIKAAGNDIPAGQITFFRSAFAVIPIIAFLAWRGVLAGALHTSNFPGHLKRGFLGILAMGFGFYGLVHLPMPEAIALGYASPLLAVMFAALLLGEVVRLWRWGAVLVGMLGVMVILWPRLTMLREGGLQAGEAMGAIAVLLAAALGGLAMIQVRQLVVSEKTATIVLYFSLSASVFSLATLPFGWEMLEWRAALLLIMAGFCGGVAQIFLTESYRHADVSTVAPFEYSSIIFGSLIAYVFFGDLPTTNMLVGTAIVVASGIFIIYREHQLGLRRRAASRASLPQG